MHACKPILGKQKQNSHDCFRTAVTIPLLGLDTLPPRAGQNWFCWSGKGSPTSGFHIGQAQLPLDHDSEVPSPSFKAQKPEEHGLCCDPRETEATIQQPWSVPKMQPLHRPLTASPALPPKPTHIIRAEPLSLLRLPGAVPPEEKGALFASLFPPRPKKRRLTTLGSRTFNS